MGKAKQAVKSRAKKLAKSKKYEPGLVPGQSAAGHHAFKSRAQARLFFANPKLRRWAVELGLLARSSLNQTALFLVGVIIPLPVSTCQP